RLRRSRAGRQRSLVRSRILKVSRKLGLLRPNRSPERGDRTVVTACYDPAVAPRARTMGYVESTLLPGETIVGRARLHWIVFAKSILVLVVGLALFAVNTRAAAVVI